MFALLPIGEKIESKASLRLARIGVFPDSVLGGCLFLYFMTKKGSPFWTVP